MKTLLNDDEGCATEGDTTNQEDEKTAIHTMKSEENVAGVDRAQPVAVNEEVQVKSESRKMDINMICGSPASDASSTKPDPEQAANNQKTGVDSANGANGAIKSEKETHGTVQDGVDSHDENPARPVNELKPVVELKSETKENNLVENGNLQDNESSQSRDAAFLSSKKRLIIRDDDTDSSDTDGVKKNKSNAKQVSSPLKKKHKVEKVVATEDPLVLGATDTSTSIPSVVKDSGELSKIGDVGQKADEISTTVVEHKTVTPSVAIAVVADDNFDINCECCLKDYDMRYLDPPLVERPAGEWRCFECLVNDARGWPRRRKPAASPTSKTEPSGEKTSMKSVKRRSSSSSSKRSRPTSASKPSSSKNSSKRKKTSGSSTSASKKSSSKKKHRKKKSSSSSSHSHHKSSGSHHRRRHHQEYSKLLTSFQARNKERLSIEEMRMSDPSRQHAELLESPTSWRVVSSTLENLRELIEVLSGGSLEQERCEDCVISNGSV